MNHTAPLFLLLATLSCGGDKDDATDAADTNTEPDSGTDAEPITDPNTLADLVDPTRYDADLQSLALPRAQNTPGWIMAQDTCANRLTELGYEVTLHEYGTGTNVVGKRAGSTNADGAVIVSAHYDSVPDCTGADDNASGLAATLEAARVLALGQWRNDLVVACWDEEEEGLIGAKAWAQEAAASNTQIQLAWSFETMAYASSEPDSQTLPIGFNLLFPDVADDLSANDNRGDFIAFVADVTGSPPALAAFNTQAQRSGLPVQSMLLPDDLLTSPLTADLQRSDHAAFWAEGYPAVMLTDTANFRNDAYHCLNGLEDSIDRLDIDFAVKVTRATVGATAVLLGPE